MNASESTLHVQYLPGETNSLGHPGDKSNDAEKRTRGVIVEAVSM